MHAWVHGRGHANIGNGHADARAIIDTHTHTLIECGCTDADTRKCTWMWIIDVTHGCLHMDANPWIHRYTYTRTRIERERERYTWIWIPSHAYLDQDIRVQVRWCGCQC